jgi:hypothetical protein
VERRSRRSTGHLLALIEFDPVDRRLRGDENLPPAEITAHINSAVEVFLRGYRPD